MYQRLRYFQHLSHSLEAIISKIEYKEQNIIEWKKKTTELVYKCLKKMIHPKPKQHIFLLFLPSPFHLVCNYISAPITLSLIP